MTKFQEIREAHVIGSNGQELEGERPLLQRIAHRLGKQTFKYGLELQDSHDREADTVFVDTIDKAKGINKDLLLLLQQAAKIPRENNTNPLLGVGWTENGVHSQRRVLILGSGESSVPVIDALPAITIDSSAWSSAAGFTMPVGNFSIMSEAHEDKNKNVTGVSSTIQFNTLPYDPDILPTENSPRLKESVRIIIDESGTIQEFGIVRANNHGFIKQNPALMQINLAEFLAGVQESVTATAKAYSTITSV
jgi:hypothetical protein